MNSNVTLYGRDGEDIGIIAHALRDRLAEQAGDDVLRAKVLLRVLSGMITGREDCAPLHFDGYAGFVPFRDISALALGDSPVMDAAEIRSNLAYLHIMGEVSRSELQILDRHFPQFISKAPQVDVPASLPPHKPVRRAERTLRHYNAQFEPTDLRGQFMFYRDSFESPEAIDLATRNPVATLVGYLLSISSYTVYFNTAATTQFYVDVGPDDKRFVEPADVQRFMRRHAQSAEMLGPYPGFSRNPDTRAAQISRLEALYPAIFKPGVKPEGTFEIHCAAS